MENNLTTAAAQAHRLEQIYTALEAELQRPTVMERLRHPADENEWSAMQTLGHMVEMIPYWLHDCQKIIDSTGAPLQFGRGIDAPERLEGVEQGTIKNPDELLGLLKNEFTAAARYILNMPAADRDKKGLHIRRGEITVAEILETFVVAHAEDHLAQVRKALQA